MKCVTSKLRFTLAAFYLLISLGAGKALAASDTVSITVAIQITPIVQIEFPQGSEFQLYIPSREEGRGGGGHFTRGPAPHLDTAQIPFIVTGNARVTVSAEPGEVFAWPHRSPVGQAFDDVLLGKAIIVDPANSAEENAIPYTLWIEFPAAVSGRSPAGLGNPSGKNPTKHSSLQASVANGPISGIVHVVPSITWGDVASGRFVNAGIYSGEVQVTVTANGP